MIIISLDIIVKYYEMRSRIVGSSRLWLGWRRKQNIDTRQKWWPAPASKCRYRARYFAWRRKYAVRRNRAYRTEMGPLSAPRIMATSGEMTMPRLLWKKWYYAHTGHWKSAMMLRENITTAMARQIEASSRACRALTDRIVVTSGIEFAVSIINTSKQYAMGLLWRHGESTPIVDRERKHRVLGYIRQYPIMKRLTRFGIDFRKWNYFWNFANEVILPQ